MFKIEYTKLDSTKDILNVISLEVDSDAYNIQGAAINSLVMLDYALKDFNISAKSIEGILFSSRDFEYVLRYGNMNNTTIYLIVNETMNRENLSYIQTYVSIMGFLEKDQEVLDKIKKERCFLIYGNERVINLVGEENLAKNYIPQYKDRFKELE